MIKQYTAKLRGGMLYKNSKIISSSIIAFVFMAIPSYFCEQDPIVYSFPSDKINDQYILSGMVSVSRSLDVLLKGNYGYDGITGESCEIDGNLFYGGCPTVQQYSCRADGYIRFYEKTGTVEFKEMAEQYILKMYKIYSATKDKYGNNILPLSAYVDEKGKIITYDKPPQFTRFDNCPIPYNQSAGVFNIKSSGFPDAFGIGMLQLAEKAHLLSEDSRKKMIQILHGMADLANRDYMKYRKGGIFLFRTDDFSLADPGLQEGEPVWSCMGSEIIYSVLALAELKEDITKYEPNLMLFLNSYVSERGEHLKERRIEYLDSRVMQLAKFFESKGKYEKLTQWVFDRLPGFYAKKSSKPMFMLNGSLTDPSNIPLLDLYCKLDLKNKYRELWGNIFKDSFGEKGIYSGDYCVSINNSGYAALLDFGYQGWLKGFLMDEEFINFVKVYYSFKGNPAIYRDLDDWVIETEDWDKEKSGWKAAPFDAYPVVESEAYYKGKPQAFTTHTSELFGDMKENQKKENQNRNNLIQFCAPFENHAEGYRSGLAQAFNLLDTRNNDLKPKNPVVRYKEPKVPKGTPVVGSVDVTPVYYREEQLEDKVQMAFFRSNNMLGQEAIKDGLEIVSVKRNGKDIPWKVSHFLDEKQALSGKSNAKLFFLTAAEGNEAEGQITVEFKKRNNPYFVTASEIKEKLSKSVDLPLPEKQNMKSTVDLSLIQEALNWFDMNQDKGPENIVTNWKEWCMAYRGSIAVKSKFERTIKKYLESIKDQALSREIRAKNITALSKIYYVYDGDIKKDIQGFIESEAVSLMEDKISPEEKNLLIEGEALIRYGILFPENKLAKESMLNGWKAIEEFQNKRINSEGFDKGKEQLKTAKVLVNVELLCNMNSVEIPKGIFQTTEKVLEFLMYTSGSDGFIPDSINGETENIRQRMYWGSKLYNRSDFRYVAFGGLRMENSFEPEKCSVYYPETGLCVFRNSWDIRDINRKEQARDIEYQKRQVMYVVAPTGDSITAYNRQLAFKKKEQKILDFKSEKEFDYLKVSQGADKIREILFVKPNYFMVKTNYPVNLNDEFELYSKSEESSEKTVRSKYKFLDRFKYLGVLEKEKGDIVLEKINDNNYVVYCYYLDGRNKLYVEVDKNYEKQEGDTIITFLGKSHPPIKKKLVHPEPEITVERKDEKWNLVNKDIEILKVAWSDVTSEITITKEKLEGKKAEVYGKSKTRIMGRTK